MNNTPTRLRAGALASIRERGLAATTSRHIATAAGVNLAGITYHWGSKDALVTAALLAALRERLQPVLDILRRDTDPVARMFAALQAIEDGLSDGADLVPVYVEALGHARQSSPMRAGLDALVAEMHGLLSEQIAELKSRGVLPDWIAPDAMASLHLAVIDGLALHTATARNDPRSALRQFVALLAAAAVAPPPEPVTKTRRGTRESVTGSPRGLNPSRKRNTGRANS